MSASVGELHAWLRRHFPKSGTCEECGARVGVRGAGGTHFAYLRHPEPHTRDRADYRELCPTCHSRLDAGLPPRGRAFRSGRELHRVRRAAEERAAAREELHVAIRLARAAGETQADVARAAGLSPTRIAQIEREPFSSD